MVSKELNPAVLSIDWSSWALNS